MGIQSAFGDFGAFIAILTTLYIAVRIEWSSPLYIWSSMGIICLFIGLNLTKYTPKKLLISKIIKNKKQTTSEAIIEWFNIVKRFKLLIPLFVVSSTSYGLTISYLPLFLDENTALTLSSIGLIISLWIGVGAIACLFYDKIQSHIRRKNLITISYIIIGVMGLSLTIITLIPIMIIIVILLGLSTFLSFPALFSFVSEATHENVEGKTFGYIFTIQLGFGTFFLFLSGVFADILGIWIPFAFLGILGLFAVIIIFSSRRFLYDFN
jgi:MFS family permease